MMGSVVAWVLGVVDKLRREPDCPADATVRRLARAHLHPAAVDMLPDAAKLCRNPPRIVDSWSGAWSS